jgi:predicted small secreted protein
MFKRLAPVLLAAGLVAGCAGMQNVSSDVSSYGQWPSERKPGSYAFERLPSQQAQPERQAQLEAAARAALEKAGFTQAADPASADVTVQLGARVTRYERSPWDDPFWWPWGAGYWRHPGWYHPRFGFAGSYTSPYYDREVALLIRDRRTGTPLYETRATSDGYSYGSGTLLAAMFEAALKDFPTPAVSPRRVTVPLASAR